MSKTKQLWTLLRFQLAINRSALLLLMMSGFPYIITVIGSVFFSFRIKNFTPDLEFLIRNSLVYFVAISAPALLNPDFPQLGKRNTAWESSTEFLLTRAVDRRILYRARALLFYILLLAIPVLGFFAFLRNPNLSLFEYNESIYQQILRHVPGSLPGPPGQNGRDTEIFIHHGYLLITLWRIWLPLCLGALTLSVMTCIGKFKYGWLLFLPFAFALLFFGFQVSFLHSGTLDLNSTLFFIFASHQSLCWLIAIPTLALSLLWYEQGSWNSEPLPSPFPE